MCELSHSALLLYKYVDFQIKFKRNKSKNMGYEARTPVIVESIMSA